ncbi:MAG: hypothetical protein JJT78_13920 [Leptospira sp.]|nr:hypothetical protein [Leptospira sp.]
MAFTLGILFSSFTQCLTFEENPLDPNSGLNLLIRLLRIQGQETTITRTEWELLDSSNEPPEFGLRVRQISPPSEYFLSTNPGFPIFVLEQRGFGEFEYEISDLDSEQILGTMKILVENNANEETLISTLEGSNEYTLTLKDFFQGKESEVSPFFRVAKLAQTLDGIDYSIGYIVENNNFGSPDPYLIRGNNPNSWEISKLAGLPDFSVTNEKGLQYHIYFLDNGAFLAAREVCNDPEPPCLDSEQSYVANISFTSPLPPATDMRIATRPAPDRKIDFRQSFVFSGKLAYKTITIQPRYYRTNDGFISSSSTHEDLGPLNQTCFDHPFKNPIQFSSRISSCFINSANHYPTSINVSNQINFNDPNANYPLDVLPLNYSLKDFWILGGNVYKTIFNIDEPRMEIYRAPNPFNEASTDLNENLNFIKLQELPISNLGSPVDSLSFNSNIVTSFYYNPNNVDLSRVLSSIDGGNNWVLSTPPRINGGTFLFYASTVRDGRILLSRQALVGTEYYSSLDGVNWQRERVRHRRLP